LPVGHAIAPPGPYATAVTRGDCDGSRLDAAARPWPSVEPNGNGGGQKVTNPINDLLAKALGVAEPWFVKEVAFDAGKREMIIGIDFVRGTRFPHPRAAGEHRVHDIEIKRLWNLNFFQHQCILEVRVPRVELPNAVALGQPGWFGKLSGSPCCSKRWC
jgi:hypothetical protein